ncbi:SAF domain-containing protein [Shewanella sp. Isolate13]|uniref:SAF domain-containing protein n=1 Tax=Shewanella sp. Isolate13 TaxID=2908531 RepID=UPI001EFCEBD5|nr:SAF domain-containing protein [Shewanella sp. Isolate13]MCG9729583.1 SAF domain-containing protein [Shewanella sp. Isolate13]
MKKAIQLDPNDNVATLLVDAVKGDEIEIISSNNQVIDMVTCLQAITFGNKVALTDIAEQQLITKAAYPVGIAIKAIPRGELAHVQNVRSQRLDIPDNIIEEIIKQMGIEQA